MPILCPLRAHAVPKGFGSPFEPSVNRPSGTSKHVPVPNAMRARAFSQRLLGHGGFRRLFGRSFELSGTDESGTNTAKSDIVHAKYAHSLSKLSVTVL